MKDSFKTLGYIMIVFSIILSICLVVSIGIKAIEDIGNKTQERYAGFNAEIGCTETQFQTLTKELEELKLQSELLQYEMELLEKQKIEVEKMLEGDIE